MKNIICLLLSILAFTSCGNEKEAKSVAIEPSEKLLRNIRGNDFSVVLDDMKIDEEPDFVVYKHKYNVLKMIKDSLHQEKQAWQNVNKDFFLKHENDLGMEILSRHNGKVSRVAQPVGFGWAIGNEKHGEWEAVTAKDSTKTTSSRRLWRSHGTSPFFWYWLGTRRSYYRNDYSRYQKERQNGRAYYGNRNATGKYDYGTRSTYQEKKRSSFFTRKKANTSKWNRLKRSSSRYSKGSSTRSRSGGIGK